MIKSFRDKVAIKVFNRHRVSTLHPELQRLALLKLDDLDAAANLNDLRASQGNRLEALHGDRQGQYSIRINRQWRICFRWEEDAAYDVEIVDYH